MKTLRFVTYTFFIVITLSVSAVSQSVLTALDGTRVDVEGQKGKVVVLAVGASWLPLSSKQIEYANTLAKKYQGKDVVFYFVATDSVNARSKNFASNDSLGRFALANKFNGTVLRDSDGVVTLKKYDIDQIPSFVILNKNGDVATEPFGGIDPDPRSKFDLTVQISKVIDRLLL